MVSGRSETGGNQARQGYNTPVGVMWAGLSESQAGLTLPTGVIVSQSECGLGGLCYSISWQMLAQWENCQVKLQNHLESAKPRSGNGSSRETMGTSLLGCHADWLAWEPGQGRLD